jgi:hypothetical protein
MSYSFNGTNQYLSTASAPATAAPVTLAINVYKNSAATSELISLSDGTGSNLLAMYFDSTRLKMYIAGNSLTSDITTTTDYAALVWAAAAAVFTSSTSRTVYLNGSSEASGSANLTPGSLNQLRIGWSAASLNGNAAEAAVWSAALTADEVVSLAKGFKPTRIRPQSLVFYAPLIRNLQDTRGALTITNNNTATVADHPRVY